LPASKNQHNQKPAQQQKLALGQFGDLTSSPQRKYWCWSGSSRHRMAASRQPHPELGELVDFTIDRDRAARAVGL
jgi:hypothetical protein